MARGQFVLLVLFLDCVCCYMDPSACSQSILTNQTMHLFYQVADCFEREIFFYHFKNVNVHLRSKTGVRWIERLVGGYIVFMQIVLKKKSRKDLGSAMVRP